MANAPRGLVGQLAREDEIAVAGPLLRRSPVIDEQALILLRLGPNRVPSPADIEGARVNFARLMPRPPSGW